MRKLRGPLFTELEQAWYERLRLEGFEDIEAVQNPDRPLRQWHSLLFRRKSQQYVYQKYTIEEYVRKADDFANNPQFPHITQTLSRHGNCLFTAHGIAAIWDLHRMGKSERAIATQMDCSRSCITFLLRRLRRWMELL
jgi:hypothetical protein